jgi:hypothetical protein
LSESAKLSLTLEEISPTIARHLGIFDMDTDIDTDTQTQAQTQTEATTEGVVEGEETHTRAAGDDEDGCDKVAHYNLYCVTQDEEDITKFREALVKFNQKETNDLFVGELTQASEAYAGLCGIAAVVSFDYTLPLSPDADVGGGMGGARNTNTHTNTQTPLLRDTSAQAIVPALRLLDAQGAYTPSSISPGDIVQIKGMCVCACVCVCVD